MHEFKMLQNVFKIKKQGLKYFLSNTKIFKGGFKRLYAAFKIRELVN